MAGCHDAAGADVRRGSRHRPVACRPAAADARHRSLRRLCRRAGDRCGWPRRPPTPRASCGGRPRSSPSSRPRRRRCRCRAGRCSASTSAACCWCWLQLAGPRSAFDTIGRAGFYHALEHWSGYPELGLLMAVATCAMVAFACAARPPPVRVAGRRAGAGVRRGDRVPAIAIGGGHDPDRRGVAARRRRREVAVEGRGRGAGARPDRRDGRSPCAAAASPRSLSRAAETVTRETGDPRAGLARRPRDVRRSSARRRRPRRVSTRVRRAPPRRRRDPRLQHRAARARRVGRDRPPRLARAVGARALRRRQARPDRRRAAPPSSRCTACSWRSCSAARASTSWRTSRRAIACSCWSRCGWA